MGKLIKVLIVCGIGYGIYSFITTKAIVEDVMEFSTLTVPLLNDVSKTWSYLSLKKHIDPVGFEGHEESYIKMLKKVSYLGKFKVCESLSLGAPKNLDVEGAQALTGTCDFENGKGNILQVFIEENGKFKTVTFIIKPV